MTSLVEEQRSPGNNPAPPLVGSVDACSILASLVGRWLPIGLTLFMAMTITACRSCNAPRGTGAQVHGLVYAELADSSSPGGNRQIFIPDVRVFVKDLSTHAAGPDATTHARGFYAI